MLTVSTAAGPRIRPRGPKPITPPTKPRNNRKLNHRSSVPRRLATREARCSIIHDAARAATPRPTAEDTCPLLHNTLAIGNHATIGPATGSRAKNATMTATKMGLKPPSGQASKPIAMPCNPARATVPVTKCTAVEWNRPSMVRRWAKVSGRQDINIVTSLGPCE